MGPETTASTRETQFVLRRLEEALHLFGRDTDARWFWAAVLVVVLGAGLAYVVAMYRRDSRSVGWFWATFLATLRCAVYLVLAAVFLLPAEQTWEKTAQHSKVVLPIDVTLSMHTKDGVPGEGVSLERMPTRLDKVIGLLTDERVGFLKALEKNPVHVYRFGGRADEEAQVFEGGKVWSAAEWNTWLRPNPKEPLPEGLDEAGKAKFYKRQELYQQLLGNTNLPDSLLDIFNREANNMVQGIVVISDGRSTQYSSQALADLQARAGRARVPIFTVVVGEDRRPARIQITDLQTPEQARPDDQFPVRVEVEGEGLPDRETVVYLDVTGPDGQKHTFDKPLKFGPAGGGPPHGSVEFPIEAARLGIPEAAGKKAELPEGDWTFQARVPKDRREFFVGKEHTSESKPVVHVVKKPLRVLLFAGAATRDYQFVRSLLVREADQHRAEVSIYLQLQRPGVVQDVPPERLLQQFPRRLGESSPDKVEDRYASLSQYDLILAFDPDWSELDAEQLNALEKWVNLHAGGLILVAGPVNTYQLARPTSRERLKPILDLFPVVLRDSRLQNLGIDRPTTEPWRLHFPGANAEMEFLKLDEEAREPLAGWEEFFTGQPRAEPGREMPAVRGFYTYYPVESAKPGATVVATFGDPRARTTGGAREEPEPYLVTMPFGSGKVVYLGSGETWRLRQHREVFFERFWMKLARYAGSGNLTRLTQHGHGPFLGSEYKVGQLVTFEAQLFGRDLQALSGSARPRAQFKTPPGVTLAPVELTAKPGQTEGWFQGRFRVPAPGEYRLELPIPESGDILTKKFLAKEANAELDDTRPDFGQMYQLASPLSEDLLARLPDRRAEEELRRALEATAARLVPRGDEGEPAEAKGPGLPRPKATPVKENAAGSKDVPRLFFDLDSARLIPRCMKSQVAIQRSRGPVKDLWDQGFMWSTEPPVGLATVLLIVVGLLSLEWLTRKLLKLA